VTAVDVRPGVEPQERIEVVTTDLEVGEPVPWVAGSFGAVVVTNYLHRPLFADLVAALAPGGVLLYETFSAGHERYGRPSRPEFLLRPGELLELVQTLELIEYRVGQEPDRAAITQSVAARRPMV
jgi:SAM-dependent methyltransferase